MVGRFRYVEMPLGVKRTHKRFAQAGVDGQTAIASIALLASASDGLHDANGWRHNVFLL
jgi:hypothetical protein